MGGPVDRGGPVRSVSDGDSLRAAAGVDFGRGVVRRSDHADGRSFRRSLRQRPRFRLESLSRRCVAGSAWRRERLPEPRPVGWHQITSRVKDLFGPAERPGAAPARTRQLEVLARRHWFNALDDPRRLRLSKVQRDYCIAVRRNSITRRNHAERQQERVVRVGADGSPGSHREAIERRPVSGGIDSAACTSSPRPAMSRRTPARAPPEETTWRGRSMRLHHPVKDGAGSGS